MRVVASPTFSSPLVEEKIETPKIIKIAPASIPINIKNVPIAAASLKHIKNFEFEVYFINMTMVCSIPKCFPYSL